MSEKRLFSLDLLRGLDMFYLAIVSTLLKSFFAAIGAGPGWTKFFCSHPWGGFTLYDLIMPLFIFMCGAAIPFALRSRLDSAGRPTAAFHRHVWGRFVMLWILGMLAQGGLETLDLHVISPYCNTLQTIAVGYVVAAYVLLIPSRLVQVAIPVVLATVYGCLVHFGGDYTKAGNVTVPVELAILNSFLPPDNVGTSRILSWGYTWFLPSLMFPVIALSGAFSTLILRNRLFSQWGKAGWLFVFGVLMLGGGLLLELLGIKCVKQIFTVSFTFQAIGWSILALAALYVFSDIWKIRRGTGFLILFGQFALTAYLCEAVFREAAFAVGERTLGGLARFFPPAWGPFISALLFSGVVFFVLIVRRKASSASK